ncbi:GPCR, PTH11-type [Trichoderma reesei QM6a]|uniref:GPCR, PTH11-type n=2 Tax=Hypocrea jecorina TaxID=51453 RepID=G0RRB7_HYPJQ|nr:GPCR, PTH11-type [Trichoderma reesei QM6a]EGR46303.1 GPCR, PTH11-type [Trichoderma reesei QM6a]ETR99412.1 hypothetical protein M419DRAFT_142488 [Trichoderma reesei RUT C-30]
MATPEASPVVGSELPPINHYGAGIVALSVVMPLIATGWLVLRVWTRRLRGISPFLVEDIFCYLGLFFFWAMGINGILMVVYGGLGNHLRQLQPIQILRYSQILFANQVLYASALGFTKTSLALMLKRIFFTQSYSWVAYCVIALNASWVIQTILTGILICQPVTMNWDPTARGHCGNQTLAFAAVSIVDIITDLAIMILPLQMVSKLHMKRTYKVALMGVFGLGFVTIIFTAVRLYLVFNVDFLDITYSAIPTTILGILQLGVANIVISAPLLRPVLDRTLGKWFSLSVVNGSRGTPAAGSHPSGILKPGNSANLGLHNSIHGRPRAPGSKNFQRITESEENLRWEMDVMHSDKGRTTYAAWPEGSPESVLEMGTTPPAGKILKIQSTEVTHE